MNWPATEAVLNDGGRLAADGVGAGRADGAEARGGEAHHIVTGTLQIAGAAQAAGQAVEAAGLAQRQRQRARQIVIGPV